MEVALKLNVFLSFYLSSGMFTCYKAKYKENVFKPSKISSKRSFFAIVHWESFKENVLLTGCTTTALLLDSLSVGVFIKL